MEGKPNEQQLHDTDGRGTKAYPDTGMDIVAKMERMDPDTLMSLVTEGKIAICAKRRHIYIAPEGIGSML